MFTPCHDLHGGTVVLFMVPAAWSLGPGFSQKGINRVSSNFLLRRKMLQEADSNLASARVNAVSLAFSDWRDYIRFTNDMDRATLLYRYCGLSLLSRRVRATRDKCFKVLGLKQEQRQGRLTAIWAQFVELNAKDHFDYTARQRRPKSS